MSFPYAVRNVWNTEPVKTRYNTAYHNILLHNIWHANDMGGVTEAQVPYSI